MYGSAIKHEENRLREGILLFQNRVRARDDFSVEDVGAELGELLFRLGSVVRKVRVKRMVVEIGSSLRRGKLIMYDYTFHDRIIVDDALVRRVTWFVRSLLLFSILRKILFQLVHVPRARFLDDKGVVLVLQQLLSVFSGDDFLQRGHDPGSAFGIQGGQMQRGERRDCGRLLVDLQAQLGQTGFHKVRPGLVVRS